MRKFMSKTSVKALAIFVILACGPIPLDLGEFFSLFYPENATSPTETNLYFYTPLVLNEDTEAYYTAAEEGKRKESLEQKLNVEAWRGYLTNKVKAKELQMGLYESGKLLGLVKKVKSIDINPKFLHIEKCIKIHKKCILAFNIRTFQPLFII